MAHILYPIVFHSVALPTDALNFDPKPFIEASLILLLSKKMGKQRILTYLITLCKTLLRYISLLIYYTICHITSP